jgi:hypothetical protein
MRVTPARSAHLPVTLRSLLRDACAFVARAYAHLLIGLLFLIALTLPLVILFYWLGI